jgi:hypothetical protein
LQDTPHRISRLRDASRGHNRREEAMVQAAQVAPVGRNQQASPQRWQRALHRALFAGVDAKQLAGSGEWIVSSASRPGLAYRTDGVSCDCEAAMLGSDPVCLHRAAYWFAQGVLARDPEPGAPASGGPCPRANTLAIPAALAA